MSNSIARVNYDELIQIAKQLHSESEDHAQLNAQTRQRMDALQSGWQGDAAKSFFCEMNGTVLPASQRVVGALQAGESVLNQIMQIIHGADEETASFFKGLDGDGTSSSTGGGQGGTSAAPPMDWLKGFHVDLDKTGHVSTGKKLDTEIKAGIQGEAYKGNGYKLGTWDVGVKAGMGKDGISAGIYGEVNTFEAEKHHVWGSSMFGFTTTGNVTAGSLDGFAGMKDSTLGASIGGSLLAVGGGIGLNIAGVNVGANVGIAEGLDFGIKIGKKTTIDFGPFEIGLSFGSALTNDE